MAKAKGRAGSKKPKAAKRVAGKKKAAAPPKARRAVRKAPAKAPAAAPRRAAAAPPKTDAVRELARRIVDVTVGGDDAATFALYADNVESQEMGMAPTIGIAAIKQKFAGWRSMVSDSTWDVRRMWVFGNTIIIEWVGHVTLAATGKKADMREVAIHEVENGKIARERFYYDRMALQPGPAEERPAAAAPPA